jgi:hypothetical protein
VDVKHTAIPKLFEKEVNFLLKGREEKKPTKKRNSIISMNLKLKEENKIILSFDSLMEDDSINS